MVITLAWRPGSSGVQIPLKEEKFSPLRFFFWREPLNPPLPLERTFKLPSQEVAALYANQVLALYANQEDGGFRTQSQVAEKYIKFYIMCEYLLEKIL